MLTFFDQYKDVFSGISAIATACAVLLALVGLLFAYHQLKASRDAILEAQKSINVAVKSLEASTIYAIQKDGRELFKSLQKNPQLFNYIYNFREGESYDHDLISRADLKIAEAIQYFSSVFNQRRNAVIPDTYWDTFAQEICSFLQEKPVSRFWLQKAIRGKYSKEFKEFGNSCLNSGNDGR